MRPNILHTIACVDTHRCAGKSTFGCYDGESHGREITIHQITGTKLYSAKRRSRLMIGQPRNSAVDIIILSAGSA